MKPITCPSCGAENTLPNPAVVSFVCPYCETVSYIDEEGLKSTGTQSRLSEGFSRLYRGGSGSLDGAKFIVLGRVRYSFGRGFWDEWYVEWESGDTSWITEDNHQFSLQKVVSFDKYFRCPEVGKQLKVEETPFQILETGEARCLGIEGSLPKEILPNETYLYADGVSFDGSKSLGIEYDDGETAVPRIFIGTWISHASIKMDDDNYAW